MVGVRIVAIETRGKHDEMGIFACFRVYFRELEQQQTFFWRPDSKLYRTFEWVANRGAMNQHRASASPRKSSVRVTYLKIVTYTLLNKGRADRSSNQDEKPKSVTK